MHAISVVYRDSCISIIIIMMITVVKMVCTCILYVYAVDALGISLLQAAMSFEDTLYAYSLTYFQNGYTNLYVNIHKLLIINPHAYCVDT